MSEPARVRHGEAAEAQPQILREPEREPAGQRVHTVRPDDHEPELTTTAVDAALRALAPAR